MTQKDWAKQLDEMTKAWLDAQSQVLDSWAATTAGARAGNTAWRQTVDAWKAAIDGGLDAQAAWAARWAESMPGASGSEASEVEAWARQGRAMFDAWIAAQRQLWASWFQTVRSMDPSAAGVWNAADRDVMKLWQDAARQLAETQAEWMRKWTSA